jgi:hypothetical protein
LFPSCFPPFWDTSSLSKSSDKTKTFHERRVVVAAAEQKINTPRKKKKNQTQTASENPTREHLLDLVGLSFLLWGNNPIWRVYLSPLRAYLYGDHA